MDRHTAFRVAALPFAASLLVAVGAGPAQSTPVASTQIVLPSDGDPSTTPTQSPADTHATHDMTGMDHSEHSEHGVTPAPVQPESHAGHEGHEGQEGQEGHVHEEGDDCGCGAEGHDAHGDSHGDAHGDSHGGATVDAPSDGTRQLVLGGFTGVNGVALGAAAFLRRRNASKRGRHLAARAAARPTRTVVSGDER